MKPDKLPPHYGMRKLSPLYFREGTEHEQRDALFVLTDGGLGDYINESAAILWAAQTCPQIRGKVYVSGPFLEVAKYLFEKPEHEGWQVFDRSEFAKTYTEGALLMFPKKGTQLINPTGAHLMDLGWMYYAQRYEAPEGFNYLPEIKYRSGKDWGLSEPYIVFTPGHTSPNRQVPPKVFNSLLKHCIEHTGYIPVFLGRSDITEVYKAKFSEEYDYSLGIDLREKTTLLEAIEIMGKSQFVIGLDNGLLHMAGCTPAPIIFGHNVSPVRHRAIRRKKGRTFNISVSKNRLSCIGCQCDMRYLYQHAFSNCIYGDSKCLDILFEGDLTPWKVAIERAFSWGDGGDFVIEASGEWKPNKK